MFFITDKPLKKRKQDSYPQEPGAEASDGLTVQGGNTGSKLTHKKMNSASNGATRPALMVSIDLQQAGRMKKQPVVVLESNHLCEDHIQRLKSNTDEKVDKVVENRPGPNKQHADNARKSGSDVQPVTEKQESRLETKHRPDGKTNSGKGHSDGSRPGTQRQKHNRISDSRHKEEKNHNSHQSHVSQTETPKKMIKAERNCSHGEDKGRDRDRDEDKDTDRDKDKERQIDKEKDRDMDKYKDINKEKARDTDIVKDRDTERDMDTDTDRVKERDTDKEKDKDRNRDREKDRNKDKDRDREKDKDKDRQREKDRDRERDKNKVREKDKDKERERDKDKVREKNKDKAKEKDKDKERERDKDKIREKDKDKDREKDKDKVREKDKDKDRHRDNDKDRKKERDRNRDKDKDLDEGRDKERVRDREKKQKKLSRENCNKPEQSPDRNTAPASTKVKQDESRKSTDLGVRERTEGLSSQTPQNKKERRSGDDGISCQTGNKPQSFETKPTEFPSYLLGGNTGSLKNFVIPKLKRDPQLPRDLVDTWKEPLVRLERVSLVDNLSKGPKPIVVLQKLHIDEIKDIIKESKNAHKCRNQSSSDISCRGMIIKYIAQWMDM